MTNTGQTQRGTKKEAKKPRRRSSAWEVLSSRSTTQFPLTRREIEVLRLLAEGASTREIANIRNRLAPRRTISLPLAP